MLFTFQLLFNNVILGLQPEGLTRESTPPFPTTGFQLSLE
jgi:hypothetical protein